ISLTNDLTAEICKLMENTFRDVNVALANVFARMAEEAGVDVWEAIELANRHPRVKILRPGPGTGGHCISVDPWFLVEAFPEHADLVRIAREVNDSQPERLLNRMMAAGKLGVGDKLAILGAAYKADVDALTDTRTDSDAGQGADPDEEAEDTEEAPKRAETSKEQSRKFSWYENRPGSDDLTSAPPDDVVEP
ncbi:MAG: hypothetical protein NC930_04470, partial [Candidatus Omnitrophica bacterium]|nr:hypothetical protein [Candidatus Omnitrophota bacterium]